MIGIFWCKFPFFDKLDVGNYAFGQKNENFPTKSAQSRWIFWCEFPLFDKLDVGNCAFGRKNENFP